jgi:hypothetical protein
MLDGRDARLWPLGERREALRELIQSTAGDHPLLGNLQRLPGRAANAVRRNHLEGIVAKRAGSHYRSGERSADWLKWRVNRGQEFVIGGYLPSGDALDSILVGYYEGRDLIYAGSIRAGIPSDYRRALLPHLEELRKQRCPVRQPARPRRGSLGRRHHHRENGYVPLAGPPHSRAHRVPRMMGWTQPSLFEKASAWARMVNEPSQRRATEGPIVDVKTLGIDLAKNLFRVHGVDPLGRTVVQRTLRRRQLLLFMAQLKPCLVGMEACGGAHYWAREITKLGHQVKLMNPHFVRPYVKSNKNDAKDAEAICEAVARPSMRFVAIKSQAQQDMLDPRQLD